MMFDVGSDSVVLIELCCVDVQMEYSIELASGLRSYKDRKKERMSQHVHT
jgi:hypothetical protein